MLANEESTASADKRLDELIRSDAAQTAQLTLISILLAAILGALFIGLPANFPSQIFRPSELVVDIRVLATLLAALDLWIEFAWSVISRSWAFSVAHNVSYFLLTGTFLGLGLTVGQNGPWLAWAAASCFAALLAAIVNSFRPLQTLRRTIRHQDRPSAKKHLQIVRSYLTNLYKQLVLYLLAGIFLIYLACYTNQTLPDLLWHDLPSFAVSALPMVGAVFALVVVVIDFIDYAASGLPREPKIGDLFIEYYAPSLVKPEPQGKVDTA